MVLSIPYEEYQRLIELEKKFNALIQDKMVSVSHYSSGTDSIEIMGLTQIINKIQVHNQQEIKRLEDLLQTKDELCSHYYRQKEHMRQRLHKTKILIMDVLNDFQ